MPGIKELKTRIKSISSTRKITRAMQMVSAAKMRKAQQAALNSRTYSSLAWELIHNLSGISATDDIPALLKTFPESKKTGIIIISTNKGLVGGFNANLMAKLNAVVSPFMGSDGNKTADKSANYVAELLVMGRKAKEYALRTNKNMMADFAKSDTWQSIESIYPLAKMVSDIYATGQYKQIVIIYNQFVSTLVQRATVRQLLPFAPTTPSRSAGHPSLAGGEASAVAKAMADRPQLSEDNLGASPPVKGEYRPQGGEGVGQSDYLFEPSPELVLNNLLPRIIESQIYQAVLESDASEHSARMVMMKNATEAAGDIISDLTLTYNGLRQSKITTELSEITAGRIALE
jgi:F-type H+-transporting ATPase subunit gamma